MNTTPQPEKLYVDGKLVDRARNTKEAMDTAYSIAARDGVEVIVVTADAAHGYRVGFLYESDMQELLPTLEDEPDRPRICPSHGNSAGPHGEPSALVKDCTQCGAYVAARYDQVVEQLLDVNLPVEDITRLRNVGRRLHTQLAEGQAL